MIFCAECGLHFAKDGDGWRCVECPSLVMLPSPKRYRVAERTFGSLDEALRYLEATHTATSAARPQASGRTGRPPENRGYQAQLNTGG
jgi:hypothetical protein